MKQVTFYGIGNNGRVPVGKVVWTGNDYQFDTDDLRTLLTPVIDPDTSTTVNPNDNPERWLECLKYTFRSPYFCADDPIVV